MRAASVELSGRSSASSPIVDGFPLPPLDVELFDILG